MALQHSPSLVMANLAFYLDAANSRSYPGSGTAWSDLMFNNNATLVNSPTFSSTTTPYFSFNGTNNEVTTTITYAGINSSNFTFSGWFRTSTASGRKIIGFQSNQTGTTVSSYDKHVYVNTSGKLTFGVYNGTTNVINSAASVTDSRWHNFAAVYKTGAGCELYLDGASVGTMAANSSDTEGYLRIAGYALTNWPSGSSGYFTGDIAVLSMHRKILTASEVIQNFNALRGRFGV